MAEPEHQDAAMLHDTLEEAHKANRALLRQLSKEQRRHHEATRVHDGAPVRLLVEDAALRCDPRLTTRWPAGSG